MEKQHNTHWVLCYKSVNMRLPGFGGHFLVVLIAAVALFKNQIISLVTSILDKITTQSNLI